MSALPNASEATVLRLAGVDPAEVDRLLARYGLAAVRVSGEAPIPASFWGDSEAGLAAAGIYFRSDTPVHSLLHELGHYVCMSAPRRRDLWRDAESDGAEECAVCYLQVLLAEALPGMGRHRCFDDMDAWGYSFREGSARAWFAGDGREARAWLLFHRLIDVGDRPTWRLRA